MASDESRALRQEYKKTRDIVHKRVQRLEKAGKLNGSSLKRYEKGIPEAKKLTDKQIKDELDYMKRSMNKESGSLKGVRDIEKRRDEAIKEEKERMKERFKYENDEDEIDDDYIDSVFNITNSIMEMMRAYHLSEAFYQLLGGGQNGYDTLSERVEDWLSNGGNPRNIYQAFREIIGPELEAYDEGVQILNRMRTNSGRRNVKAIRNLGDTLASNLGYSKQTRKKKER